MDETLKRLIDRAYPELSAGAHLPRYGEVVAIREPSALGDVCDEFRPRHAVSVRLLNEQGLADERFPVLHDVAVPVQGGGHERGALSYPDVGAHVELGFAYGSPNKPFIRSVLPFGRSLPAAAPGEFVRQHSAESFDRIGADGDHLRVSAGAITDDAGELIHKAFLLRQRAGDLIADIERDEVVTAGGMVRQTAMGAIVLESGGRLDLGALGDVNVTSKGGAQRLRAATTWIGSQDENVLGLLSEALGLLSDLCGVLATHTHPTVGVMSQGGDVSTIGDGVDGVKVRLDGIKV